jgi:flavodoxin
MNGIKRLKLLALMIAAMISLAPGCSTAQQPSATSSPASSAPDKRILIVYLSRTNNTKAIAEMIRDNVGGTLVPLELEKPYPENYEATVQQVARENETGYLPQLKTRIDGIEKYEVVFLGFPTWGMQLPPPIKSFLTQYTFKGKTVVPFNTIAGYGEGRSFQTVRELCPDSTILEGFVTRGGVERDGVLLAIKDERAKAAQAEVKNWLRTIKMLQ